MTGFQMPITIFDAMRDISSSKCVLPAFQREFLWDMERIERLFDSLMRGYPTSTMLFWKIDGSQRTTEPFYKFLDKFVFGARDLPPIANERFTQTDSNDFYAVLDGQQRLTAIRIGLFGTYAEHERNKSWCYSEQSFPPRRLYLRLREHCGGEYSCKYIFEFKKIAQTGDSTLYTDEAGELWFRVGDIVWIHQRSDYDLDDFCEDNGLTREQKKLLRTLEKTIFTDKTITYYLEEEQSVDKAVSIFTRINSGGITLNFSDLIFSLLVATWQKDAKAEILSLIKRIEGKGFNIDKDFVVKAFLYLFHKGIKTEIGAFNRDFCSFVEERWEDIKNAIEALFDLLLSYRLDESTLTSLNATLPILYYLYHRGIYNSFTSAVRYKSEREIIKKWLLCVLLRRAFSFGTDGVLAQTRRVFTEDIGESYIREDMTEFPAEALLGAMKSLHSVDDDFLDELLAIQKDHKSAFPILALLYPNLDYKNNDFHKDHLHPKARYDELDDAVKALVPFELYNSIINLQMLGSHENTSKGDKSLEEWVALYSVNDDIRRQFLENHLIPDVSLSPNDIVAFFSARRELLKQRLRELLA